MRYAVKSPDYVIITDLEYLKMLQSVHWQLDRTAHRLGTTPVSGHDAIALANDAAPRILLADAVETNMCRETLTEARVGFARRPTPGV